MIRLQLLGGLGVIGPDPAPEAANRKRSFALLALVAAAAPQAVAREKLLAYLWPESDSDKARNSLRQTLFALRRDLGEEIFLPETAGGLQLDPSRITVDLWELRDAIARGETRRTVEAWRGSFLDGFSVAGLEEFSHWVDSERERITREYMLALEAGARIAWREGRMADAVSFHRFRSEVDPLSARVAMGYLKALVAAGDRAGAIMQAANYERVLRERLDAEMEPAVAEYVAELKAAARTTPTQNLSLSSPSMAAYTNSGEPPAVSVEVPALYASATVPAVSRTAAAEIVAPAPKRFPRPWLIAAAVLVVAVLAWRWDATTAEATIADGPIILGSAMKLEGNRDVGTMLIACEGPGCPTAPLPIPAYVVPRHPAYAPPSAGTEYIAPMPNWTMMESPGLQCCTTATFETTFRLPEQAAAAMVSISLHADNQATVRINGIEFGRQADMYAQGNFASTPTMFSTPFVPDPSGMNRLQIVLYDAGGAGGLQYSSVVNWEKR